MLSAAQFLEFSHRIRRIRSQCLVPLLERTGLTPSELDVLLFLSNNPSHDTARDVAEYRQLAKSQVSQAVEGLVRRGLLRRAPDVHDRRVVRLSITETGAPMAREAQALQAEYLGVLAEGLDAEELARWSALMERIFANAEKLTGKEERA
jgi:DNA-binding MarR family transcriptional regulator